MANLDIIYLDSMLKMGTILRGTYRIDGQLSSGSFGNTYVVTHIYLNEKYAIKEFFMNGVTQRATDTNCVEVSNQANLDEFNQQLEKFKKEARRLRSLHDNHIVRVHDLFEENGTAYYVMDYIDGEDLRKRLDRAQHPLSESEVKTILDQTLSALSKVHDQGIWHLDLKPANIMVDSKGCVKLIDFGASKQSENKTGDSSTAVAFTNGYAPIEQMERSSDKFGPWTDFYALGATLYNLLTNQKPPMPSDINNDHTPDKRLALALPKEVGKKMRDLILWLMKPNYKERPRSVEEIRDYFGFSSKEHSISKEKEDTLLSPVASNCLTHPNRLSTTMLIILGLLLGSLLSALCFWLFFPHFLHEDVKNKLMQNGTYYTGYIIRGTEIRDGHGSLKFVSKNNDTTEYVGEWKRDRLAYGTRITKSSVYKGQFDDKLRNHGFGIIKYNPEYIQSLLNQYPDSVFIDTYWGNWIRDHKHGLGRALKTDGSMEFGEYKNGVFQPVAGTNYRVGDKIYGIDASSRGQKFINWDNLALYCDEDGKVFNGSVDDANKKYMQPVFFAYLKATDGLTPTWKDSMYVKRVEEAKRHGIPYGSYHFFRYNKDITSQVNYFIETAVWNDSILLPPALDVEKEDNVLYDVKTLREKILFWLETIERRMGIQPIIYTNDEFLKEYLDAPEFKKYRFWVARYNIIEPSYSDWQFWQKTETARMRGCDNDIDVNLFNGNYHSFQKYIEAVGKKAPKR